MAQRKKAPRDAGQGASPEVRPGDADLAGGADAASVGAGLAVEILVADLRAIPKGTRLDPETGALVALYARTLSAIENSRLRRGGGRGDLADKSTSELLEMALELPEVRAALGQK